LRDDVVTEFSISSFPSSYRAFWFSDQYLYRERVHDIYRVMDEVSEKYGKHSLHLGASHLIEVFGRGKRGEATAREKTRFPGETKRRHLSIPILHVKV
jgi:DNA polymerase-4/DNA polymerase V